MTSAKPTDNIEKQAASPIELGAITILLLAAFVILRMVLLHSNYGIDLTDEGMYLHWMANPSNYSVSISQFGFIYHPIYKMANGDVAIIRQSNYLITFFLASASSFIVLKRTFIKKELKPANSWPLLALSAVVASSSLLVTCFEMPQSPSYNTLAYQAILLGITGVLLADTSKVGTVFFGYVLVGISWWLAFMAKPTTAVALGLTGLLYFLIAGKFRLRLFAVSITTAALLLLGTAWMIDGSIPVFIERFTRGIEVGRTLGAGNSLASIWRWDNFPLPEKPLHQMLLTSAAIAFVIFLSTCENTISKIVGIGTTIVLSLASIAIATGGYPIETAFERYYGLQILALPIGCLIAAILTNRITSMRRSDLALAISLLLLPHAYAFGTDRPYWLNAQGAALFWILSGMVLLSATKAKVATWQVLLPVCGASVLMVSLFVFASMEHPMRQTQPLRLDTELVDIGQQGNQLILSHDFAEYIQNLRQLALAGEFKANTPIIDLTGHSPGTVYALNGTPPGVAWLLGGYKGSKAFAVGALDLVTCNEIAQAWVITEPSGPGKLPASILERYGIDLEQDYQDLGAVQTPAMPFPTSYAQHLLKPRRTNDDAKSACELKRRERAS